MKNNKGKIRDINSYRISDDIEDYEVDREIRRDMIREGRRMEKDLDSTPELDAIGEAPALLDRIIEELREKGEWDDGAYQRALEREAREKNQEKEFKFQAGSELQAESDTESEAGMGSESETEGEAAKSAGQADAAERLGKTKYEFAADDVYDFLPERDQIALRRGRAIGKFIEKWDKSRKKILRTAAMCVLAAGLLTVSMGTEANREHMIRVWTEITNTGQNIFISKSNDSCEGKEEEDRRAIKEGLGIAVPLLVYKPENMIYEEHEMDRVIGNARMYYITDSGNRFTVYMSKEGSDIEEQLQVDGRVLVEYDLYVDFLTMNVTIQKLETPKGDELYKTEYIYNNTYYLLMCKMKKAQFEKIIKKMVIS